MSESLRTKNAEISTLTSVKLQTVFIGVNHREGIFGHQNRIFSYDSAVSVHLSTGLMLSVEIRMS